MGSHPRTVESTGRSGLELVLSRAATDVRFRRHLLIAPHAAIREAFGVELPSTLRLRFVERAFDVDLMVVLPDVIDPHAPLDERDLGPVTGGVAWRWLIAPV